VNFIMAVAVVVRQREPTRPAFANRLLLADFWVDVTGARRARALERLGLEAGPWLPVACF